MNTPRNVLVALVGMIVLGLTLLGGVIYLTGNDKTVPDALLLGLGTVFGVIGTYLGARPQS